MTDQHTIREEQAEDARERADFDRITGEDIARHERELDGERVARELVDEHVDECTGSRPPIEQSDEHGRVVLACDDHRCAWCQSRLELDADGYFKVVRRIFGPCSPPPIPEHGVTANPLHGITASDRRGSRPFSMVALRMAVERAAELINDAELRERVTGRSCGLPIALDVATLRELTRAAHRDLARFSPATKAVPQ